jgi:hypothetical protein
MSKFYQRVLKGCAVDKSSNSVDCKAKTYYNLNTDTSDAPPGQQKQLDWLIAEATRACRDACGHRANVTAHKDNDPQGDYILSQCEGPKNNFSGGTALDEADSRAP